MTKNCAVEDARSTGQRLIEMGMQRVYCVSLRMPGSRKDKRTDPNTR